MKFKPGRASEPSIWRRICSNKVSALSQDAVAFGVTKLKFVHDVLAHTGHPFPQKSSGRTAMFVDAESAPAGHYTSANFNQASEAHPVPTDATPLAPRLLLSHVSPLRSAFFQVQQFSFFLNRFLERGQEVSQDLLFRSARLFYEVG
jgi:hypothetical protein